MTEEQKESEFRRAAATILHCVKNGDSVHIAELRVRCGYRLDEPFLAEALKMLDEKLRLPSTKAGEPTNGKVAEMQPTTPSSIEFLQKAVDLQQERAKAYDVGGTMAGERSMGRAVHAFNIITGHTLRESDGWLLLQLLKDVRDQTNGPHMDSLEDCVSYAALKAEARAAGK